MALYKSNFRNTGIFHEYDVKSGAAPANAAAVDAIHEAAKHAKAPALRKRVMAREAKKHAAAFAAFGDDVHAMLGRQKDRMTIEWQLEQIEPGLLACLSDFNVTIEEGRNETGTTFRYAGAIPANAPPMVRDAAHALHWLERLRDGMERQDIRWTAIAALQLGYFVQMFKVRPFEPHVAAGAKSAAGSQRAATVNRKADAEAVRRDVDAMMKANPMMKREDIYAAIGQKYRIGTRTVRRHVNAK